MPNTPRILFLCEAVTLAHVVRPLLLAQTAEAHGYDVIFAAADHFDHQLENIPTQRERLSSRTPEQFTKDLGSTDCLFPSELLDRHAREELSLYEKYQPDLIVSDLRPSASVSARAVKIPVWTLSNAYWSPFLVDQSFPIPSLDLLRRFIPRGALGSAILSVLKKVHRKMLPKILLEQGRGMKQLREHYGLPEIKNYRELFLDGDQILYGDIPQIFEMHDFPSNHTFLGHIPWSPPTRLPAWVDQLNSEQPLVFVSLGSSGSSAELSIILKGLQALTCTVVVSHPGLSKDTDFSSIGEQSDLYVGSYLPGDYFAEKAAVVITNGGSPSSYQALIGGSPVLGIPSNMDQFLSMQSIERADAGKLLRADTLTNNSVTKSVRLLLSEHRYTDKARKLRAYFQQYDYRKIFSQLLTVHFSKGATDYERVHGM